MDLSTRPKNGISLCAGGGGLDMGLQLTEPGFHTRLFVEWEPYARDAIIAAQRAGYFAPAPIWDDLTTFDAKPFAGAIDTLLAGYPCQPFSAAGQRKGEDDPRHLFPHVARVADELGPDLEFIILENVPGHVTLGLEAVLRTLLDMGFAVATGLFSASETGAPHERLRMFIVAYRPSGGQRERGYEGQQGGGGQTDSEGGTVAHADGGDASPKRQQCGWQQRLQSESDGTGGKPLANAGLGRRAGPAEGENQQPRGTETFGAGGVVENPIGTRTGRAGATSDQRGRDAMDGRGTGLRRGDGAALPDGPTANGGQLDHTTGPRRQPARIGAEADLKGRERLSGAGRDDVADSSGAGLQGREQPGPPQERDGAAAYGPTAERGGAWLHPPGPSDTDAWALVMGADPSLAPSFARRDAKTAAQYLASLFTAQQASRIEQRAGSLEIADILRAVESEAPEMVGRAQALARFRGVASGLAERTRALRLLGNGVCPLAAGYAIRTLLAAHGIRPVDLGAADRNPSTNPAGVVLNDR